MGVNEDIIWYEVVVICTPMEIKTKYLKIVLQKSFFNFDFFRKNWLLYPQIRRQKGKFGEL